MTSPVERLHGLLVDAVNLADDLSDEADTPTKKRRMAAVQLSLDHALRDALALSQEDECSPD